MSAEKKDKRHPWRENIEALTMAIAVALLFKYFILEISKIPSGSMQPTLMGSPETSVFDRIVVDKLSFHYRDPKRFEIVVFKHPLERSRVMVKRLVGMPGEELKIEHGDLWTRPDASSSWTILRRPPAVQAEMWKSLEQRDRKHSNWRTVEAGGDWRMTERDILARGDGRARFRVDDPSITNRYTDGYPDALRNELTEYVGPGTTAVSDLRLEGEVEVTTGTSSVSFTLTEGRMRYDFYLVSPDEGGAPFVRISDERGGSEPRVVRAEGDAAEPIAFGESVRFAVENLDDRLTFEIDGDVVVQTDVAASADSTSSVSIAIVGTAAEFDDLMLYRDVHYTDGNPNDFDSTWTAVIPEGHYVMLGDNTLDSADGRDWRSVSLEWTDESGAHQVEGNYRPGQVQGNPNATTIAGERGLSFRNIAGDLCWVAESQIGASSRPLLDTIHRTNSGPPVPGKAAPLVPRELIQGRAVAVFWPISPSRGLWRRAWLH